MSNGGNPIGNRRVLVIGWDAADWKIISPLMDSGKMPNIRRLVENGVMGNIATLHPVLSPMLWTSIATGKRPFKHGIYGFYEPTPDGLSVQPITNLTRTTKAVWNILNQNDKRCHVVGWWPSHPAEPINGVMVSDFFHKNSVKSGLPELAPPGAVHPESMLAELSELRFDLRELSGGDLINFIPNMNEVDQSRDPRLASCAKIVAECTTIQAVATEIMETADWDFMAVYFDAIDHFSHGFMKYHPPRREFIPEADYELYKHVVTSGYIYHDMMLGRMLELAGDDATVILLSDHGFHPDHLRPKFVPMEPAGPAIEHRDFGIFVAAGPGINKDKLVFGTSLLDITPTILHLFDLPIGDDMDGRVITEAFIDPPVITSIASWDEVVGNDGCHAKDKQLDPVEAQETLKQLVELGYIAELKGDQKENIRAANRELNFNLARAYMDASQYGDALPILTKLYAEYPKEYRIGIQLAMCYKSMNRVDDLERLVERVAAQRVRDANAARKKLLDYQQIAIERSKERKTTETSGNAASDATVDFDQADVQEMKNDENVRNMGEISKLFSPEEIKDIALNRSIAILQNYFLDFLKAFVLISKGKAKEAIVFLERAIAVEPTRPSLHIQIGEAYLKLRAWDLAYYAFEKALGLDENNPHVLLGIAKCHIGRRENELAARRALDCVSKTYFYPVAHYTLGVALSRMGRFDNAIDAFKMAVNQNPNFSQAYRWLAFIFKSKLKDQQTAGKYFRLAREAQKAQDSQRAERAILPTLEETEPTESLPVVSPSTKMLPTLRTAPAKKVIKPPESMDPLESIVVVTGLPRSGTSVMMQMLAQAGLEIMTDGQRVADEDNPRGYLEYEKVKTLLEDNTWVVDAKGKVIKVVAQLLDSLPAEIDYKVIYMQRDIEEIIQSQRKMLDRNQQSGGDIAEDRLKSIFEYQMASTARLINNRGIPAIRVPYRTVLAKPVQISARIKKFLAIEQLDVEKMAAAVDPSLYRNRLSKENV